jgi:thiol-disulfide isomerase/thioredoxin
MEHLVELFVAHHCPSCPDARQQVREFAETRPNVRVIEHNVDEALAAAEGYGLFATPAIVIDRRSIFYGVPTLAQLAARCKALEVTPSDTEEAEAPRPRRVSSSGLTTAP